MNLIKKIILSATIAFTASAFAQQEIPDLKCNGDTQQYPDIKQNLCWAVSGSTSVGFDYDTTIPNNTIGTFYIWLADIKTSKGTGTSKVIRVYVDSNNPYFKEIQAIAQTAYVTKSAVFTFFHNPNSNPSQCFDNGTTIDCPLISLSIAH